MTIRDEVAAAAEALLRRVESWDNEDRPEPETSDLRAALAARGLTVVREGAEPHPDEPHEFRTTCLRCGEKGFLHMVLITSDQTVTIVEREPSAAARLTRQPEGQ